MCEKRSSILKVGVGRVIITPPVGTILYGYPNGRKSEAVGDDLHAIAAADMKCGSSVIRTHIKWWMMPITTLWLKTLKFSITPMTE